MADDGRWGDRFSDAAADGRAALLIWFTALFGGWKNACGRDGYGACEDGGGSSRRRG